MGGNVALGGKLNVALSPGGRFDVGIYRIINYGGTLSNPAGLTLGTLPAGANAADYFIQTSVDKQVNLAYTNGLTLNYWDGDAGPKNNNQVNGGAGTWVAPGGVNDNWTDAAGSVNAPWSQGAFAASPARAARCGSTARPTDRSTCRACSSPPMAMCCKAMPPATS